MTDSFEKRSAVLHAEPFNATFNGMLGEWGIKKEQVHLFVRDNATNMVKAMRDGSFDDFGCFAHTLQLVVHDGVLSQRSVVNTLAQCRHIVGHFKRSPLAFNRLKSIQTNLGLPFHSLKQDEPTRWNSTLHILQSILEQKMALAAYATDRKDCCCT